MRLIFGDRGSAAKKPTAAPSSVAPVPENAMPRNLRREKAASDEFEPLFIGKSSRHVVRGEAIITPGALNFTRMKSHGACER